MVFIIKIIYDIYVELFCEIIAYLKTYNPIYILYTYYTITDALWFSFFERSQNKLWFDYIKVDKKNKIKQENPPYINSKNARILDYSRFIKNIPFSPILDNTEGIAAFQDLFFWSNSTILLDIGCGKNYRDIKRWIEKISLRLRYFGVDPYECTKEHNERVQCIVEANGGVDIVTSMSVLNTIPSCRERLRHIQLVYSLLHYQCPAYFKIYAGNFPYRGTGIISQTVVHTQNNRWAHEYAGEIEYVFGKDKVYVDCEKNLIIACK